MNTAAITSLPHRLEPWGMTGWTVREFASASDAADFFCRYPAAAMPCWRRPAPPASHRPARLRPSGLFG
jgi:hypothetical protein